MGVRYKIKGSFKNSINYMNKLLNLVGTDILDHYGKMGVKALQEATPEDTGETAKAWEYKIERTQTSIKLVWINENRNQGIPIAFLIQYGHGLPQGGYVEGVDYINPALKPVFDKIEKQLMRRVKE